MLALLCMSRMADGGCVAYKLVQRKQGWDRWNKRFREAILRFSIVLVSRGTCRTGPVGAGVEAARARRHPDQGDRRRAGYVVASLSVPSPETRKGQAGHAFIRV